MGEKIQSEIFFCYCPRSRIEKDDVVAGPGGRSNRIDLGMQTIIKELGKLPHRTRTPRSFISVLNLKE